MPELKSILEITEPIEFEINGDRLHFTAVSGASRTTFSISFHKARTGAHIAIRLLDEAERQNRVIALKGRK